MPLPKLRCKWDHMQKSIVWILFNSKCGIEREKNKNEGGSGERVLEQSHRIIREIATAPVDPAASHWSFFTLLLLVVGSCETQASMGYCTFRYSWGCQAPPLWGRVLPCLLLNHGSVATLDLVQFSGRPQEWGSGLWLARPSQSWFSGELLSSLSSWVHSSAHSPVHWDLR